MEGFRHWPFPGLGGNKVMKCSLSDLISVLKDGKNEGKWTRAQVENWITQKAHSWSNKKRWNATTESFPLILYSLHHIESRKIWNLTFPVSLLLVFRCPRMILPQVSRNKSMKRLQNLPSSSFSAFSYFVLLAGALRSCKREFYLENLK